jgi:hypothetical protein
MALRPLADQRDRIRQRRRQVEARQLELHAPGLDLGEVEDVVDEREQVAPGLVDVLQILGLLLVDLAEHALRQHLREADDRVERRPQLVRHVGEELRLVLVRHLELRALFLDLRNRRAFSMAMTACVANDSSRLASCDVNGRTSTRQTLRTPIGSSPRSSGTDRTDRTPVAR